jgi:hypothetical protein
MLGINAKSWMWSHAKSPSLILEGRARKPIVERKEWIGTFSGPVPRVERGVARRDQNVAERVMDEMAHATTVAR